MADEKTPEQIAAEAAAKAAEEKSGSEEREAEGKPPDFEEIKNTLKDLREKFVGSEKKATDLEKELQGLKGTTEVVDRLKKVLGGEVDETTAENERKRAEFYKLLVQNPTEAIRQIYRAERAREIAAEREKNTERDFETFSKLYPEYKEYEEDMKQEMLSNPAWFEKPNFIRRVFFDVLSQKNPELLAKIVAEKRETQAGYQPFLFEGSSQSLHGSEPVDGAAIMDRMRKAGGAKKSYFE